MVQTSWASSHRHREVKAEMEGQVKDEVQFDEQDLKVEVMEEDVPFEFVSFDPVHFKQGAATANKGNQDTREVKVKEDLEDDVEVKREVPGLLTDGTLNLNQEATTSNKDNQKQGLEMSKNFGHRLN